MLTPNKTVAAAALQLRPEKTIYPGSVAPPSPAHQLGIHTRHQIEVHTPIPAQLA